LKKLDLGQSITILANLGVIAGIVFLAIEIQQNTVVQETQMRFSQNERQTEVLEELFRNPELTQALVKHEAGELLTRYEDILLSAYSARAFASWQWVYGEIDRGTLELDPVEGFRGPFHDGPMGVGESSIFKDYWARLDKSRLDADFVKFMEENVVNER